MGRGGGYVRAAVVIGALIASLAVVETGPSVASHLHASEATTSTTTGPAARASSPSGRLAASAPRLTGNTTSAAQSSTTTVGTAATPLVTSAAAPSGSTTFPSVAESTTSASVPPESTTGPIGRAASFATTASGGSTTSNCIYPKNSQALMHTFVTATGATINCVLLFNNCKPSWATWTNVWWAHPPSQDMNWMAWKQAVPGRRLIISQPMVPDTAPADWRQQGAAGAYDGYATQLATNLVNEGLGDSVIRLGWEANDTSQYAATIGTDPALYGTWATYWARIVRAMRAVPGAHFLFDWTVNAYWRPIPLDQWYPGDDVVDIIGIDAYDSGISNTALTPQARWTALTTRANALNAVGAYAQAHGKPMSLPEWGLCAVGSMGGAGDDPTYVQGLADFIASHNVIYDAYFFKPDGSGTLLTEMPRSLAAYAQYLAPLGSPQFAVTAGLVTKFGAHA